MMRHALAERLVTTLSRSAGRPKPAKQKRAKHRKARRARHGPSLKKRNQVMVLALGAGLQAVLIAILWAERRRRTRGQQELRRLSGQLLTAQEDERGRIARDLHDHICQQLALLAIELDVQDHQDGADVASLGDKARAIAADVQTLARELHPSRLEHLGLIDAVRRLGLEVERLHRLRVEVAASDWPAELPRGLIYCFYCVAQEALQNVLKHSRAETAQVAFRVTRHGLQMIVSDDGCGFDAGAATARAGLGVASMRERLRVLGGTLTIHAAPGRGTRLRAEVPRPEL
jgi:signal transduction histidine kinase